jgi:hypothetical protein
LNAFEKVRKEISNHLEIQNIFHKDNKSEKKPIPYGLIHDSRELSNALVEQCKNNSAIFASDLSTLRSFATRLLQNQCYGGVIYITAVAITKKHTRDNIESLMHLHYFRGAAYFNAGVNYYESARLEFEACIRWFIDKKVNYRAAEACCLYGRILLFQNHSLASQYIEKCLELNPGHEAAKKLLADINKTAPKPQAAAVAASMAAGNAPLIAAAADAKQPNSAVAAASAPLVPK